MQKNGTKSNRRIRNKCTWRKKTMVFYDLKSFCGLFKSWKYIYILRIFFFLQMIMIYWYKTYLLSRSEERSCKFIYFPKYLRGSEYIEPGCNWNVPLRLLIPSLDPLHQRHIHACNIWYLQAAILQGTD